MSIFTSLKALGKTGVSSSSGKAVVSPKLASTLKGVDWGSVVNTTVDVYNKLKSKPEAGTSVNVSPDDPKYYDPSPSVPWYKQTWFTVGVSVLGAVGLVWAAVKFIFKKNKSSKRF